MDKFVSKMTTTTRIIERTTLHAEFEVSEGETAEESFNRRFGFLPDFIRQLSGKKMVSSTFSPEVVDGIGSATIVLEKVLA